MSTLWRTSEVTRHRASGFVVLGLLSLLLLGTNPRAALAQQGPARIGQELPRLEPPDPWDWFGPDSLTNTMTVFLVLTILTLVPSILIMTTSFVRTVIVLAITRQALGTQQLPPNSVLTTIALFMMFHIMHPVYTTMYYDGVVPYSNSEITHNELVKRLWEPMRDFMAAQIEMTGNQEDVWMFLDFSDMSPEEAQSIETYDQVPPQVLLPAYMLSEIRTGFLIGFQIFLPFLIIDMTIASILVSMGMMMLPPVLISLPFKLLLFVLVDGWTLISQMLLTSFVPMQMHPPMG